MANIFCLAFAFAIIFYNYLLMVINPFSKVDYYNIIVNVSYFDCIIQTYFIISENNSYYEYILRWIKYYCQRTFGWINSALYIKYNP